MRRHGRRQRIWGPLSHSIAPSPRQPYTRPVAGNTGTRAWPPDLSRRRRAAPHSYARGFLLAHVWQLLWWAGRGLLRGCRFLESGRPTPLWSTPTLGRVVVGLKTALKESSHDWYVCWRVRARPHP